MNKELESQINSSLSEDRLPFHKTRQEYWNAIQSRIEADVIPINRNTSSIARIAIAASFLLFVASFVFHFQGQQTIVNGSEEMAQISLPDGSIVKLNAGADIAFNENTWFINRSISLNEGEAFFQVKRGKTFTVKTDFGKVKVLGTSFNVNASDEDFTVACKTGLVAVDLKNSESPYLLESGDLLKSSKSGPQIEIIEPGNIGLWTEDLYIFSDTDVKDVLESISYNYNYSVEFNGEISDFYSGTFSVKQPLNDILETICLPMNLRYTVDASSQKIIITK